MSLSKLLKNVIIVTFFYHYCYYNNCTYDYRKTIKKLLVRVHDTKCNMEKMFLHFEIAKCHIQINIDYWKNAQVHVIECFKLAHKMNCHTYIINSTILMGSIEFPTGFTKKTSQAFNVALEYAHSIEEPGVIMFMQKVNFRSNT